LRKNEEAGVSEELFEDEDEDEDEDAEGKDHQVDLHSH